MSAHTLLTADVVIVGSGVAGALIAYELATAGTSVVVLESGPRVERSAIFRRFLEHSDLSASAPYPNTPLAPRPGRTPAESAYLLQDGPVPFATEYLRLVGGTTWHWGGVAARLRPSDFEMKQRYGVARDWPIRYGELEPYYLRAERELGVAGDEGSDWNGPRSGRYPLPPLPASYLDKVLAGRLRPHGFRLSGLPHARNSIEYDGRPACRGLNNCTPICPIGAQYCAITHVDKAEAAGARVLDNTLVSRLRLGGDRKIASVSYRRPDGSNGEVGGRIFVVAANTHETTRLLLLSASERAPTGIANSSDQLGRNLMSHPTFYARFVLDEPVYPGRGPIAGIAIQDQRDGPHRARRSAYNLWIQNHALVHDIAASLISQGIVGEPLERQLRSLAMRTVRLAVQAEQLPSPENRIRLDPAQRDSAGLAKIRVSYSLDAYLLAGLEAARERLAEIVRLLGGHGLQFEEVFFSHPMGTTVMGTDPQRSVVDVDCRAHEHRNLFVAGGAVFPTGGAIPPTLTIAALSLRIAAAIQHQLST